MCTVITFFATYDLKNFKIIPAGQKRSKQKNKKLLKNKKSFSDEIKSIFHYFQRAVLEANN